MTNPAAPQPARPPFSGTPVSQSELQAALLQLWDYVLGQTDQITRIEEQLMSDQDTLNQLAQAITTLDAKVNADDAALTASVANVQQEIAALQAAAGNNQPLDFTAANDALAALQNDIATNSADIASVAALVPPPAPSA